MTDLFVATMDKDNGKVNNYLIAGGSKEDSVDSIVIDPKDNFYIGMWTRKFYILGGIFTTSANIGDINITAPNTGPNNNIVSAFLASVCKRVA